MNLQIPHTSVVRLLLVDDHQLVRDGLRTRLEATPGFLVVAEACDAQEALLAAQQHAPDVALIDIALGQTSGIELTRMLCERFPQLRVVILTMYDESQFVAEALRVGARGYILKSSPSQDIVAAVRAVATGRRYYCAHITDVLATMATSETLLTQREKEILALIAEGLSCKEIATRLKVSVRTVETHRLNIKAKLDIPSSAALVKYAIEHHWADLGRKA